MSKNDNTAQQQQSYAHSDPVYSYIEGDDAGAAQKKSGFKLLALFIVVGGLIGLTLFSYNKGREESVEDGTIAELSPPEGQYVREQPAAGENAAVPDGDKEVYGTLQQSAPVNGLNALPTEQTPTEENGVTASAPVAPAPAIEAGNTSLLPSQIVGQVQEKAAEAATTANPPVGLGMPLSITPQKESKFSAPAPSSSNPATPAAPAGGYTSGYSTAATPVKTPVIPPAVKTVTTQIKPPAVIASLPTTSVKPAPVVASPVTGGNAKIQLAAVGSDAAARAAWAALKAKYADALGGLTPVFQTATVAGKTVVRVQATGLSSPAAAAAVCAKLKTAGQGCLAVR